MNTTPIRKAGVDILVYVDDTTDLSVAFSCLSPCPCWTTVGNYFNPLKTAEGIMWTGKLNENVCGFKWMAFHF